MKLGTRQTAAGMNQLTQPLVMGKSFLPDRLKNPLSDTGTSPIIIMAQPPSAIAVIFCSSSSPLSPNEVGAKQYGFLR